MTQKKPPEPQLVTDVFLSTGAFLWVKGSRDIVMGLLNAAVEHNHSYIDLPCFRRDGVEILCFVNMTHIIMVGEDRDLWEVVIVQDPEPPVALPQSSFKGKQSVTIGGKKQ